MLSLLGILSQHWNFRLFLVFLGTFRNFRKSMKMCKMNYFSLFWKSYLVLFLTLALRFYVVPLVKEAVVEGVQAHHQKFSFGEICGNLGKISENLHKIPENLSKPLKICAKMALNGAQKNMKSFCFRGRSFFSGTFGRIRAKILRISKNLPAPCCTTTDLGIFLYCCRNFWSCIC